MYNCGHDLCIVLPLIHVDAFQTVILMFKLYCVKNLQQTGSYECNSQFISIVVLSPVGFILLLHFVN